MVTLTARRVMRNLPSPSSAKPITSWVRARRMRLATDPRTRHHDVLSRVFDGVAYIVPGEVTSIAAAEIARTAHGIREVDLAAAPIVAPTAATHRSPTDPALAKLSG